MALVKCKECGTEISKAAKACPKCGAPRSSGSGCGTALALLFIAAIGIAVFGGGSSNKAKAPAPVATTKPNLPIPSPGILLDEIQAKATAGDLSGAREVRDVLVTNYAGSAEATQGILIVTKAADEAEAKRSYWEYSQQVDPMGRGNIKHASLESRNTVTFGFPYNKIQRATLHLRAHPEYGKDVILSLEKAQFQCNSYRSCSVKIRFDDGKAQSFEAAEPADNSMDTIFIRGYSRFVTAAAKSRTVRIEAQFYQEGTRVFEFPVQNLKAP